MSQYEKAKLRHQHLLEIVAKKKRDEDEDSYIDLEQEQ